MDHESAGGPNGSDEDRAAASIVTEVVGNGRSGGTDALDDLSSSLLGLTEMLLDDTGMDEAVTNVLAVGMATLGPDPAVSLTISQPRDPEHRFVTRDATTEWAQRLDEWQYEHGEGPCLTADETGETCVVTDCRDDDRFPRFCEVASDHGVGSAVSYPMLVRGASLGSINVFFRAVGAITPELVDAGEQLARTSAPLLANWLAHTQVRTLADQLEQALEGRGTIERAKGLLMGELGIDDERAFELLRTQSQHENTKLREVASQLLERRRGR